MATKITVTTHGGVSFEVNAGASGKIHAKSSRDFTIGQHDSAIHYLTLEGGDSKVKADTGDVYVEIDGGNAKHVKKGGSTTIPSKSKRTVVRERPHR